MSKYIHFVNSVSCHIIYHCTKMPKTVLYGIVRVICMLYSVGKYTGLASTSSLLVEVYLIPRTLLLVVC